MSYPLSRSCHFLSIVGALLLVVPATVWAQDRGPEADARSAAANEAIELWTWFELPASGGSQASLEDTLAPMLTRRNVSAGGTAEVGFLPPIPYSVDQLTESARNIGSPDTLKVWMELFCWSRTDLEREADLRGKLKFKVWVENSSTGWLDLLARLRARADGGSVFDQATAKVRELREGNKLWFQLVRDKVSPLENVYCAFGYGIFREFVGDGS